MQAAIESDRDATKAAHELATRLFSIQRVPLGLAQFHVEGPRESNRKHRIISQDVVEFQSHDGEWERKKSPRAIPMGRALILHKGEWKPALSIPQSLSGLKTGSLCRLKSTEPTRFGRQVPIARFGKDEKEGELVLSRWLLRSIKSSGTAKKRRWRRLGWKLDQVETRLLPLLPQLTHGGTFHSWHESKGMLYAVLNYETALTYALTDSTGKALVNPVERTVTHRTDLQMPDASPISKGGGQVTAADVWFSLGLVDEHASPTRRGILFSFFNYGEGLAIAAALEDASYAIEDLVLDLANLRAGHRFGAHESSSNRLEAACRSAYGLTTHPGYLSRGLPATYGEGAAEILFQKGARQNLLKSDDELRNGDIERARLEWRSMLRHIAHAPDLNWDRWLELKASAHAEIAKFPGEVSLENLPPLTPRQQQRHKSFHRFEHGSMPPHELGA
jgi:hypothetical protein